MKKKISRADWDQIAKRVRLAEFRFNPRWKCLIDGLPYARCAEHDEADNERIIEEVKSRFEK